MVLQLCSEHLRAIATHAEQTYPEECCGLLLGESSPADAAPKTVIEVWPTENAWSEETAMSMQEIAPLADHPLNKTRRYWIDPKDMLEAQRYARQQQLNVIGIYHSHTDHPAIPSECDRACAWPQYAYMIVSVHQGNVRDFRCWNLDERHQFQPEDLLSTTPYTR